MTPTLISPSRPPFVPSPEQQAIFNAALTGTSISVEAVAGSGKTTTLVELLRRIPSGRNPSTFMPPAILFLAFNKSIADTLKRRCPSHVQCSTFHSLGLRALKSSNLIDPVLARSRDFIDGRKTAKLVFSALGGERDNPDVQPIIRLITLAKTFNPHTCDYSSSSFWSSIAGLHDFDLVEREKAFRVAMSCYERSVTDLRTIDFDDMLFLPVLHNLSFDTQDYLMVDEAQDTNDIQLEILSRLHKPSTRFIAVGDPYQAIYGFRGANSDAMSKITSRFSCVTMPLSVSYRCPQAVVAEARRVLQLPIQTQTTTSHD